MRSTSGRSSPGSIAPCARHGPASNQSAGSRRRAPRANRFPSHRIDPHEPKTMRQTAIILGAILFAAGPLTAAGQQQNAARTSASPTTVSAILVDVVVRDRKGDPVRDLTEGDFEIYEDGVKQDVGSMTPIFLPEPAPVNAAATPAPAAATPATPPADTSAVAQEQAVAKAPQMIALVFDRLTSDSRTLAYHAAVKYLGDQSV